MALSDKYTLNQLRAVVRRDLFDPAGKWWSNDELNKYINEWQELLQTQYEFVWSTATITQTSTSTTTATATTFTLTNVASNMMRLDAIYLTSNTDTVTVRLSPRSIQDIDTLQRDWRSVLPAPGVPPDIAYQLDAFTFGVFPPPVCTMTYQFEYPDLLTMTHTTTVVGTTTTVVDGTMAIPAWTRYSVVPYVRWRAFSRFGPNQDVKKAMRAKAAWERQKKWIRRNWDGYLPEKAEMLRPGRRWAGRILRSRPQWPVWQ